MFVDIAGLRLASRSSNAAREFLVPLAVNSGTYLHTHTYASLVTVLVVGFVPMLRHFSPSGTIPTTNTPSYYSVFNQHNYHRASLILEDCWGILPKNKQGTNTPPRVA